MLGQYKMALLVCRTLKDVKTLRKRNTENELCLIKLEMKKIEIENEIGGNPINLKKEILRIKRKNKRARKKIVRDLNKIHLH